jgi:hypothetical protein
MGHLPFNLEQHRQARIAAYEQILEDSRSEADDMLKRLESERQNVQRLPSHYQYLKHNIYGGAD